MSIASLPTFKIIITIPYIILLRFIRYVNKHVLILLGVTFFDSIGVAKMIEWSAILLVSGILRQLRTQRGIFLNNARIQFQNRRVMLTIRVLPTHLTLWRVSIRFILELSGGSFALGLLVGSKDLSFSLVNLHSLNIIFEL